LLCGEPAHPEVRVHHVRRVRDPAAGQLITELRHEGQQLVLGQLDRRPGLDVLDGDPRRRADPSGQVGMVPAGVHGDLVPPAAQRLRELRDVHVLPAGIHPADRRKRARVLGDQVDPHRATSWYSRAVPCWIC
jgi:hypothetical protein